MPNIILKRFMLFNSNDGRAESREGDKLLYHWTKDAQDFKVSLNEQIDDVCLCDASVNISNRLKCNGDQFEETHRAVQQASSHRLGSTNEGNLNQRRKNLVLTFDSTLILIVEVDPNESIWMAVHVAPPAPPNSTGDGSQKSNSTHSLLDPSCIPTDAIERFMNNIYARFCLLNGTFQMLADEARKSQSSSCDSDSEKHQGLIREKMRATCEDYFNVVLPNIHLNSIVSNVASLYNYILYLDLNPLTLMKINSFINHLVCLDANQIRHTIVIFNDQLLWSSLNMYDTRILYNYLVSVLIRDALHEELSMEVDKVRRIKQNMPIYLTDSPSEGADSNLTESGSTRQDVHSVEKLTKHYLTVFRSSNNMTLGLILAESNQVELIQKCEQILTSDSRLGVVPLASLAQSVGQNFLKANLYSLQQAQSSSQPQATLVASASINPTPSWMRPSSGSSSLKGMLTNDQKYVSINRLDASISWPLSMDMQNKEHLLMGSSHHEDANLSHEIQASNKKIRLIRYLIEFEPELHDIGQRTESTVEEFLGKTSNDSWLTVTNSRYRTIYSVHNVRNSGLNEAQQSAISLKSVFSGRHS